MQRLILRANGEHETADVGSGFETWNKAINARVGEIVSTPGRCLELWCDEEGLCVNEPMVNVDASRLAGRWPHAPLVGDVIVFYPGDIT